MVGLSPVRMDTPLFLEHLSAGQNFTLDFAFVCHVLTSPGMTLPERSAKSPV